jgi:hypothetical protein
MSDNLESYFKKHLRDETPREDAWNVPSDDVWRKVAPEIRKRPGIFVPWRYFYFIGAGLALIIASVLFFPENRNEFQAEKNEIPAQETESTIPKKESPKEEISPSAQIESEQLKANKGTLTENAGLNQQSENDVDKNPSIVESTAVVESVKNKDIPVKEVKSETPTTVAEVTLGVNAENQVKESGTDNTETIVAFASSSLNENTAGLKADEGNEYTASRLSTAEYIADDKFGSPIFIYSDPVLYFPENRGYLPLKGQDYLNKQKAKPIPFSQGKFGIGAYYAPTYSTTMVKGLSLPGNDQMGNTFLFGNNWGFDFYYYLSYRFTIVSGIGSSEIRSWSKTSQQFAYDSSTEHDMGNSQTANGTAQTSPTPFGEIGSEVIYSFPSDANLPDGEMMESVSETFQNIRYLSIPLGVEYNLLNREKVRWFLETGVNYNVSIRDNTELKPQILHQGDAMNIMESRISESPNYENNYWGFYIGTGVKIPVSPRIQILGTVRYGTSISPLKSIGDVKTNVQAYQLKLGVVYLLH